MGRGGVEDPGILRLSVFVPRWDHPFHQMLPGYQSLPGFISLPEIACFSHILIQDFWKSEKERNDPLLNTNGLVRVEGKGAEAVTRGHLRLAGTV